MKKIQTMQEMSSINSPALRKHLQNHMQSMFDEYGVKYASRKGGYTRIIKKGLRKGDAAMEVILELI